MAVLKYKNGSNWVNYNDLIYPVGSIVMRYTNTSPANQVGGIWTTITGRFPYFNSANGTGGSNTVTLTVEQMPAHAHHQKLNGGTQTIPGATVGNPSSSLTALRWYSGNDGYTGSETGGGEAHNNMPAYQAVWAFRRTA